ncbi:hypothetical protein NFI96_022495 [Prochilodus magdalenae]|nr:hypothetical protein NFI96_022495 [Prochilodus magdalenae]
MVLLKREVGAEMVGKIKRARHKLHHGAVKVETESCSSQKLEKASVSVRVQDLRTAVQPAAQPEPQPDKPGSTLSSQHLKAFNFPKGVFASTKITPETLVQSLKVEEPSPVQPTKQAIEEQKDCSGVVPDCHGVTQNGSGSSSVTSPALVLVETPNESVCGGTVVSTEMNGLVTRPEDLVSLHLHPYRTTCRSCVRMLKLRGVESVMEYWDYGGEEKKQQSKKEKMKERRQRWMNKISAIKVAREQQVALERRKATPVVGDMRVLADALPELTQLLPSVRASSTASVQRKQKGQVKKKAEPTDYYQMKPAQKRKLLEEETSRFSETLKDSTFKANPLAAIGEHLRKRFRQEDEQS